MHRRAMMGLLPLCCAGLLTACADRPVLERTTVIPAREIPASLLVRNEEPAPPGPNATQRDASLVIEDLREALAACNADKATIEAISKLPAFNP